MASLQPNRYLLQSKDGKTKVDYETSSFGGPPVLNLTLPPGHPIVHFSGSQIRVLNTEVGSLVTVTTRLTIDAGSTSFSVLVPAISLTNLADHKAFSTDAILTTHSGPLSTPFAGVHETYQFVPLSGEARFIFALVEPLLTAQSKAAKA